MLILIGEPRSVASARGPLIDSLIRASENDPYMEELLNESQHRDGWGRALIGLNGDGRYVLSIDRSVKPIYSDRYSSILEAVDISDLYTVADLIHARAASRGMGVNIYSTHPAEAVTRSGYRLYIIHNGTVDKQDLLEKLNVGNTGYAQRYNDTYFLAQYMGEKDVERLNCSVIEDIAGFTKTALNTAIALVRDSEIEVAVGSLYRLRGDGRDPARERYYRMYRAIDRADGRIRLAVYASSTLVDHYRPSLELEWEVVGNGWFDIYRLRPDKDRVVELVEACRVEIEKR